jgi:hypothetical protein
VVLLAFLARTEDQGNPQTLVATIPMVVGGFAPQSLKRATFAMPNARGDQASREDLVANPIL